MRPRSALALVIAFEAGLATGLARFPDPWLVLVGLGLAGLLLRIKGLGWLAAACGLGFALGTATRVESRRWCAATLPVGVIRLRIRLREPVAEGIASANVEGRRCRGDLSLRIQSNRLLPAGTRLLVTGRWLPSPSFGGRPGGLLVVKESEPLPSRPGLDARFRTWLTRTISGLYGTRAGLVEALVTGRRGEIDPTLKAAFARSGLVHLLSISGFHVGVVFGWTILLLRPARLSRGSVSAIASILVFSYVAFLGWPAPASRAALLCGLGAWCRARQRHPAPTALLTITCLGVTLMDPWALFDLGGWLSASAFFGSMVFARWSDRSLGPTAGWRLLFASLGATLTTAPFTAAAFGSVAMAGIGLNFAAIPLAALAVPAVLLSAMVEPLLLPLARALAAGGALGLAGLEALARIGGKLPFGAWVGGTGLVAALPWVALLGFALWAIGRRNTSRRAALRVGWGVGLFGVVLLLPLGRLRAPDDGDGLALHFLNVGQGDAALIRTPAGRWILVDAGPADQGNDAGREVILPFLLRHGVRRLAAVVLSHAHQDHVGGAPAVLREIPADLILEPAEPVSEPHYLEMLELADERGMRWRAGRAGDSLIVDGVVLRILHPDTAWTHWREDLNDDSLVLLVRSGSFEALLAGDLGVKAESLLTGRVGKVDLLKVGHHGSAGSSGSDWLAELRPKAAVISVGRNRYGHPAPSALGRLAAGGAEVWRTDREGTVTVQVGAFSMSLRGRSGARRYPLTP